MGRPGTFQKYLKGSSLDEDAVAKPLDPMRGWREVVRRQKEAGLPPNFRHEWVSCLFFEKYCERPTDPDELILWKLKRHLILTHHGYFAPMPRVVIEKEGSDLVTRWTGEGGVEYEVEAESTRIDNDYLQSYVELQRVFGYWGLCYLETILRASDWVESAKRSKEQGL